MRLRVRASMAQEPAPGGVRSRPRQDGAMDDDVLARISALIDEEHQLEGASRTGEPVDADRIRELEVALDQCWDLLRQRRARRSAGLDPEDAHVRSGDTVEGYQQ
jgi:hypothetical protein